MPIRKRFDVSSSSPSLLVVDRRQYDDDDEYEEDSERRRGNNKGLVLRGGLRRYIRSSASWCAVRYVRVQQQLRTKTSSRILLLRKVCRYPNIFYAIMSIGSFVVFLVTWHNTLLRSSIRNIRGKWTVLDGSKKKKFPKWVVLTESSSEHNAVVLQLRDDHHPSRPRILHDYAEGEIYTDEFVEVEDKVMTSYKFYLAFDDDTMRRHDILVGPHKALNRDVKEDYDIPQPNKCTRPSFYRAYRPNCNAFHEIDPCFDPGVGYLNQGWYRQVWSFETASMDDSFVLKVLNIQHEFDHELFEMVRTDALVMERLSSSPRIVDIYGHCGTSVATEDMYQELEFKIVNGTGYATAEDIQNQESIVHDVSPRNSYTANEKLVLALKMSEAIADLHGFKEGVIVHNDIQLCQYLINRYGQMKLNDFNRAEILLWDRETEEYCRYRSGLVYGNYRSPEEDLDEPLNEQIDVFSLGNNFYGLLTGLWIFYENKDDQAVQSKVINEELPFIDNRYSHRSFAEATLIKAMKMCWKHDPDERSDIFEIVKFLRRAVGEISDQEEILSDSQSLVVKREIPKRPNQ